MPRLEHDKTGKSWLLSTMESCIRQANENDYKLTYRDLKEYQLDTIVKETKTKGKTPGNTLSRNLQELRDLGILEFTDNKGNYKLMAQQMVILAKTSRDAKKMSKGERLIAGLLNEMQLDFIREKVFADCKSKRLLRFDFYFEKDGRGFCIEFDGEQHRRPIDYFGGEEAFRKTQERDKIKDDYCKKNNITLIRVSKVNYKEAKKKIESSIEAACKDPMRKLQKTFMDDQFSQTE